MKIVILSLFTLFLFSATAQSEGVEANIPKFSKFTFGWAYSPEVSYRMLSESDEANEFTESVINFRNEHEGVKFGQSFSVFWGYQFSKIFSLEGGIGYTDFGEGLKSQDLLYSDGTTTTLKGSNHIHFLSVPISLHVNLGGNRVRGFVSAGIAPGYMARFTTYAQWKYEDGSTSTSNTYNAGAQDNYSRFILGAHLSGGVDIKYSEKANLRIAPVFRITTTDVYSGQPIKANYFNAGIEIGTVYQL